VQRSKFRISSVIAEPTPLYLSGWISSYLLDGRRLLPIVFQWFNHCFLEFHVPTQTNPADCASRGLAPDMLERHDLWWLSPPWLHHLPEGWPNLCLQYLPMALSSNAQTRYIAPGITLRLHVRLHLDSLYSWPILLRITAYLYRSLIRVRSSKTALPYAANLRTEEIQKAKRYWLETIQSDMFPNKISALARQCPLPENRQLCALNPYFDEDELIRIRGGFRREALPSRSDEESHCLTRSSVSTYYPVPSFKNDACRCSIDTCVVDKWILDSPVPYNSSVRSS